MTPIMVSTHGSVVPLGMFTLWIIFLTFQLLIVSDVVKGGKLYKAKSDKLTSPPHAHVYYCGNRNVCELS